MADVEDLEIPEVSGFAQQARFFRQDGKDFVEISFIGNPDTVVQKVTPELMARYRPAWDAYCDGVPLKQRAGTPLTQLKEISEERAAQIVKQNVHNLEELAALNDHQCQALGHGILTLRGQAQKLVALRAIQQRDAEVKKIKAAIVKPMPEENPEIDELKAVVAKQGEALAQISANMVEMMGALKDIAAVAKARVPAAVTRKQKNGPKQHTGDSEPSV